MMLAQQTAHTVQEALWAAIVELTEAGNDLAVAAQARPDTDATAALGRLADDIATFARAAEAAHRRTGAQP